MMMSEQPILSVVIPSYQRGPILLETIGLLQAQDHAVKELIVVDQTDYPLADPVRAALQALHDRAEIIWLRLSKPSIPHAMNVGLMRASSEYVLYLDDDVQFAGDFISQHVSGLAQYTPVAQVGQIIQPWQSEISRHEYRPGHGLQRDLQFPFHSDAHAEIVNCMAGNLVVHREKALAAGGFDENFHGAAYRFETEFCRRLVKHSGAMFHFVPQASLLHLHHASGGTRAQHNYLTSASGAHSVGDYYFALRHGKGLEKWRYVARRLCSSIVARFYLAKPWFIPVRLIAELRGFATAVGMVKKAPRLISGASSRSCGNDGESSEIEGAGTSQ